MGINIDFFAFALWLVHALFSGFTLALVCVACVFFACAFFFNPFKCSPTFVKLIELCWRLVLVFCLYPQPLGFFYHAIAMILYTIYIYKWFTIYYEDTVKNSDCVLNLECEASTWSPVLPSVLICSWLHFILLRCYAHLHLEECAATSNRQGYVVLVWLGI